jgi:hypothetical protein
MARGARISTFPFSHWSNNIRFFIERHSKLKSEIKNLYFSAGRLVRGHWDGLHTVLPHASTQQLQRLPLANQELHEHAIRPRGVVMRQLMNRDKMREKQLF